jgi:hypothetical protein
MAVTYSRYKFIIVSIPKRFRNGRFTSETAARSETATCLDPEALKIIRRGF